MWGLIAPPQNCGGPRILEPPPGQLRCLQLRASLAGESYRVGARGDDGGPERSASECGEIEVKFSYRGR